MNVLRKGASRVSFSMIVVVVFLFALYCLLDGV